jgi:hypothetical protein
VATKSLANQGGVQIFPSFNTDGKVFVKAGANVLLRRIQVWDAGGRLLSDQPRPNGEPVSLPDERGLYYIVVESSRGKTVQKVVRQ